MGVLHQVVHCTCSHHLLFLCLHIRCNSLTFCTSPHEQAQGLNELSNARPILPLLDLHDVARPELYKKLLQLLRTRLIKKLEHITEVGTSPSLPFW